MTELNDNKKSDALVFLILGWIFSALSILFFPILFGPAGMVMGYLARTKGAKKHGLIIMIAAAVAMVIGFALGYLVAKSSGML